MLQMSKVGGSSQALQARANNAEIVNPGPQRGDMSGHSLLLDKELQLQRKKQES